MAKATAAQEVWFARLADYVADVEQVVADLPAPPVLIGHSLGGMVVQKCLHRACLSGGGADGIGAAARDVPQPGQHGLRQSGSAVRADEGAGDGADGRATVSTSAAPCSPRMRREADGAAVHVDLPVGVAAGHVRSARPRPAAVDAFARSAGPGAGGGERHLRLPGRSACDGTDVPHPGRDLSRHGARDDARPRLGGGRRSASPAGWRRCWKSRHRRPCRDCPGQPPRDASRSTLRSPDPVSRALRSGLAGRR